MPILIFTIIISIILDLYTKFLAKINLEETIFLVKDFIYLKYIENPGIAFSIGITGIFLKLITIALITGIFIYYFKYEKLKKNKLIDLSFGLILGGAIANRYERIFNSYVIDFVGIKYFAIFNLADTILTIGVILYLIDSLSFSYLIGESKK
ncbi:MAG: signal peptidase II [Candidatus Gracilibacteria bacterium]|nr:signal peptidase II [Candidatus Gracilibacteria bacterium]